MAEFEAPQSRNEALLQNILGAENPVGEPQSRNEAILQAILGYDVPVPEVPESRIEDLLLQIKEKGIGGVTAEPISITENGTYTAEEGKAYTPVTVSVYEAPVDPDDDVLFIDYDGTIKYSYSAAEFLELTEFPTNPSHPGLTAQGWNWSLSNAKDYVRANGMIEIGQNYVTDDGKTRLYISLTDGKFLEPKLGFYLTNGVPATINWGDGNETSVVGVGNNFVYGTHRYATTGDYVITISTSGEIVLRGSAALGSQVLSGNSSSESKVYALSLEKVELGESVGIGEHAFYSNYTNLETITISKNTEMSAYRSMGICKSLKGFVFPKDKETVTGYGAMFAGTRRLNYVAFSESGMESGLTSAFFENSGITRVSLPDRCASLVQDVLKGTYALSRVAIPNSYTSMARYTFYYSNLKSVNLPNNMSNIGNGSFVDNVSLLDVSIPASTTTIDANAFNGCTSLVSIHFKGSSPPVVANANAWSGVPQLCVIYVPTGSLSAYQSAANYPDPNVYTYVEEG